MLFPEYYPVSTPERWIKEYGSDHISAEVLEAYHERLVAHVAAVQVAGVAIGVPEDQLRRHDLSKFSASEYGAYAKHFHGGGTPSEFARAWLHHIHANPHHWQHWLFPDGFGLKGSDVVDGALPMPEEYALEMIADWMGASHAYAGSTDMTDWLFKNMPKIKLHPATARYVRAQLIRLGYERVVSEVSFANQATTNLYDVIDQIDKVRQSTAYRRLVEGEFKE